jgi:hypothetical protein
VISEGLYFSRASLDLRETALKEFLFSGKRLDKNSLYPIVPYRHKLAISTCLETLPLYFAIFIQTVKIFIEFKYLKKYFLEHLENKGTITG